MRLAIWLVCTGCVVEHSPGGDDAPPPPACNQPTYTIETGAALAYVVGVDAGYYASYAAGGAWHFEWTCDTDLSAEGCNFTGTIRAPGGANASCFRCETNDILNATSDGTVTTLQFDTLTSTGIDGVDFTATPGAPIAIDLQINGFYQNDLVFIPMGGAALAPTCMPAQLAPTSP